MPHTRVTINRRQLGLLGLLTSVVGLGPLMSRAVHAQAAGSNNPPSSAVLDPNQRMNQLFAELWDEELAHDPIQATFQGDPRFNDQLPDFYTADSRDAWEARLKKGLAKVKALGVEGLDDATRLSVEMFVQDGELELAGIRFPEWMMPVDQMGHLPMWMVQLGSGRGAQPFVTDQDHQHWLSRAHRIPVLINSLIDNMRQGVRAGVVQPKVLMDDVLPQLDALIQPAYDKHPLWGPLQKLPEDMSAARVTDLKTQYQRLIDDELKPSFKQLRQFIAKTYLPASRRTIGFSALPDGNDWYAYKVRTNTTLDLTPDQIHQIGLDEVARIHGRMRELMKEVRFKGDLQAFFRFMREDRQFRYRSEAELLEHYRSLEARVNKRVGEQFSVMPKAGFEIRPIEAFRAKSAAGGEYQMPSEDGSRPGIFYVNTHALHTRMRWDAEDLYLHEAIPGHHFQIALQQELKGLAAFRRFGGNTAYSEGWGLYAESLGSDLGLYNTPYDLFGYLQNEVWRAIRLVTDTGMHAKGWSRAKVIRYMLDNSAESLNQATAEAERYVAWPGQALAYKLGELKIQQLKKQAQKELKSKFNVRDFHAQVLQDGNVSLSVLDAKIMRWIDSVARAA